MRNLVFVAVLVAIGSVSAYAATHAPIFEVQHWGDLRCDDGGSVLVRINNTEKTIAVSCDFDKR